MTTITDELDRAINVLRSRHGYGVKDIGNGRYELSPPAEITSGSGVFHLLARLNREMPRDEDDEL